MRKNGEKRGLDWNYHKRSPMLLGQKIGWVTRSKNTIHPNRKGVAHKVGWIHQSPQMQAQTHTYTHAEKRKKEDLVYTSNIQKAVR